MKRKYIFIIFIFFVLAGAFSPVGSEFAFALGEGVMATVANVFLTISGWIMGIGGLLFNIAIERLVVNMAPTVDSLGAVTIGWETFRDFANVLFIFFLIYASIATVLNIPSFNAKKIILNVVIVGLLINFSLFFTKVVIDVANIVSLQFYNAVEVQDGITGETIDPTSGVREGGIAGVFANAMKIQSIYKPDGSSVTDDPALGHTEIIIIGVFGSIFLLITGFIFFAGAALLITRFVVLVFLMILSPLAFVAMILPNTKSYWNKWKKVLLEQAFFAPIYFAMIWLTAKIVTHPTFQLRFLGNSQTFAETLKNPAGGLDLILVFTIISGFMIGALVISKQVGATGAQTVIGWGNSTRSWVGRNVAGRLAKRAGKVYDRYDERFRTAKPSTHPLGKIYKPLTKYTGIAAVTDAGSRAVRRGIQSVEDSKFGGSMNLKEQDKRKRAEDASRTKSARASELTALAKKLDKLNEQFSGGLFTQPEYDARKDQIHKDIKSIIGSMTNKEVSDLSTGALSKIAPLLNAKQMEAIDKSDKSEGEKKKIQKAYMERVNKPLEDISNNVKGAIEELKNVLKTFSNKDFENMSLEQLEKLAPYMNGGQLEAAEKGDLNSNEKKSLRTAFFSDLKDALDGKGETNTPQTDIRNLLDGRHSGNFDKIGDELLEKITPFMNSSHFNKFLSLDKKSEKDKSKVRETYLNTLSTALKSGAKKDVKDALNTLTSKDVENIGNEILGDPKLVDVMVANMSGGQYKTLLDRKDVDGALKKQIKESRVKPLRKALKSGFGDVIRDAIRDIGDPEDLAKLERDILTDKEFQKQLDSTRFIALAKKLDAKDKAEIRQLFKDLVDRKVATEAQINVNDWLTKGYGQYNF